MPARSLGRRPRASRWRPRYRRCRGGPGGIRGAEDAAAARHNPQRKLPAKKRGSRHICGSPIGSCAPGPAARASPRAYDEACLDADAASEVAKRAREAERIAERLFEAKEKRLDAKPKRALKNPWSKVRRGYEALLERLEAKWMAELRACAAAEAEASAHALLVKVKNLEIARLKRQLRRCGL